jgi:acid phosphatase family membrane protein YuiD
MNYFSAPENYAILLIPLLMWVSAQIIKFFLYSFKHGLDWKFLFEYGHLPSSHTACVTSLMVVTGYYAGLNSPVFGVAFSLGILTIYDAIKLRAYIGDYGKTINRFIEEAGKKNYPKLKERVGHTATEAISGFVLGIIGSFFWIWILNFFSF